MEGGVRQKSFVNRFSVLDKAVMLKDSLGRCRASCEVGGARRFLIALTRERDMAKRGMSRREVCRLLPAVAIVPTAAEGTGEQDSSLPSASYAFEKLAVRKMNSGAERRDVLMGKLATGESLETHETTLQPGGMPHPPHRHVHSEMWLIGEGTLELTVNGKSYQLSPGSVGFVHSNEEHGVKNIGSTPATYFVVAVGPGAGSV